MNEIFLTNFSQLDWIIVGIYLSVIVWIGIIVNKYSHSVSNYMVAGRQTRTALNAASYIGTGLGLVTIMYASMDGFLKGFSYISLAIIGILSHFFIGATGFGIRKLRSLNLTTLPEFFEIRYDKSTRVLAGIICALAGILNMGLFPKMGATFLTFVTGLGTNPNHELIVNLITSALIVLVLIYTILGGMISVIITDFIQFIILSIGLGIGLLLCLKHPQIGWTPMFDTMSRLKGEAAFNPFHSDSYGWIYMIWMVVVFIAAGLCWAPEATRALTAKDSKTTVRTFLIACPGWFIRLAVPALWAIAAFCLFSQDNQLSSYFFPENNFLIPSHADQAMPLLMGKIIPTGLLGLLVAGLMAAFMSTHDSYLFCWASIITRDVINPFFKSPLTDKQQVTMTRIFIFLIGLFLLVWGIWYPLPKSVWTYMAVTGNIYLSGCAIVMIGGLYWKNASNMGAKLAIIGGLFSISGLFIPQLKIYLPFLTPAILGLGNYIFCAFIFIITSKLFPDKPRERKPTA